MKRRSFFAKCAAFVAGCALGVGIQREIIATPITDWTVITYTFNDVSTTRQKFDTNGKCVERVELGGEDECHIEGMSGFVIEFKKP